jgi:hypothetical protein
VGIRRPIANTLRERRGGHFVSAGQVDVRTTGDGQDRPIPNQEVPARDLEGCLREEFRPWQVGEEEPQETVLSREAEGDTPRPLVGRINGTWAAVCYDDPGGPVNVEGSLAADRLSETRLVTSRRRDGLVVALMTVAPDVERVEIALAPQPESSAQVRSARSRTASRCACCAPRVRWTCARPAAGRQRSCPSRERRATSRSTQSPVSAASAARPASRRATGTR